MPATQDANVCPPRAARHLQNAAALALVRGQAGLLVRESLVQEKTSKRAVPWFRSFENALVNLRPQRQVMGAVQPGGHLGGREQGFFREGSHGHLPRPDSVSFTTTKACPPHVPVEAP